MPGFIDFYLSREKVHFKNLIVKLKRTQKFKSNDMNTFSKVGSLLLPLVFHEPPALRLLTTNSVFPLATIAYFCVEFQLDFLDFFMQGLTDFRCIYRSVLQVGVPHPNLVPFSALFFALGYVRII